MRIDIGKMDGESFGYKKALPVTIKIELKQKDKGETLSICGSIWRPIKTDIVTGGQCQDTIKDALDHGRLELAEGQTRKEIYKLLDIWGTWHLNDMNAACSHQRAAINEMKETHGKKFFYVDNYDEIIKLPMFAKCPDCGYKYGTAWLFEQLPEDVTAFIKAFRGDRPPDISPGETARRYLKSKGIEFAAECRGMDLCPGWCDGKHRHGVRYMITFKRDTGEAINFNFWNSLSAAEKGITPTCAEVLTAVQKDDPGTFEDFCGDFGYDTDSRKAEATYDAVTEEYKMINGFFTPEELEDL